MGYRGLMVDRGAEPPLNPGFGDDSGDPTPVVAEPDEDAEGEDEAAADADGAGGTTDAGG
jgi:hypothetical protein